MNPYAQYVYLSRDDITRGIVKVSPAKKGRLISHICICFSIIEKIPDDELRFYPIWSDSGFIIVKFTPRKAMRPFGSEMSLNKQVVIPIHFAR